MYNVEIFDMYSNKFVAHLVTEESRIEADYLSPSASVLSAPKDIELSLKNTVKITDEENKTVFEGFVSNIDKETNSTRISVKPLIALLDEVSLINDNQQNYAWQIYHQIFKDFGSNVNRTVGSIYSVPWTFINGYIINNWQNEEKIYNDAPLMSDMDLVIDAARLKNRWMRFELGAKNDILGNPCYGFEKQTNFVVIEADLDAIIDKEFSFTESGGYNVGFIWSYDESARSWAYYPYVMNDDGTIEIDSVNNKRKQMHDARINHKRYDKALTRAEADEIIKTMLSPTETNFCIRLKVKKDYSLFKFGDFRLGQNVEIIHQGKSYKTNLTGYAIEGDVVEYTFGTLRESLTDLLTKEKG